MLYHHGCGGTISIDLSKTISWKSPSISIHPEGIKIGVTEIKSITEVNPNNVTFICDKCNEEELDIKNLEKFADMECPICGGKTSLEDLMIARNGFCLCNSCLKIARGDKTTKRERILRNLMYFNLQNSRMEFTPISNMVVKKINF